MRTKPNKESPRVELQELISNLMGPGDQPGFSNSQPDIRWGYRWVRTYRSRYRTAWNYYWRGIWGSRSLPNTWIDLASSLDDRNSWWMWSPMRWYVRSNAGSQLFLAIAARFDLEWIWYDTVNAFVHAKLGENDVMKMPPGYRKPSKILRLNRALYGHRKSPIPWHKVFYTWRSSSTLMTPMTREELKPYQD